MKHFLPLLILPLLLWVGCEEEEELDCAGIEGGDNICGCTDISARNYDIEATFDDGSCYYFSYNTEEHRTFADANWDLEKWVFNTLSTPLGNYDDVRIIGTHMIRLELTGSLAQQYGTNISSDSLENYSHWLYTGEVDVRRDSSFYETIGKYDQFVGGWIDCYSSTNIQQWFEVDTTYENGVSDIIIMTPKKQQYLTM